MRVIIRYFFRTLRLVLTPFMLLSEKLSTPESVTRSAEEQARADEASKDLALYQFKACPFCIKVRKEIARLGLNIETRDAQHDPEHRAALIVIADWWSLLDRFGPVPFPLEGSLAGKRWRFRIFVH